MLGTAFTLLAGGCINSVPPVHRVMLLEIGIFLAPVSAYSCPPRKLLVCSLFDAFYDRDISITFHLFVFVDDRIGFLNPPKPKFVGTSFSSQKPIVSCKILEVVVDRVCASGCSVTGCSKTCILASRGM